MNDRILWKLPVPATALLGDGERFEVRAGREAAILFRHEGDEQDIEGALVLEGIEALRITYLTASDDSMLVAYGKLVDLGQTEWLRAVRDARLHNQYPVVPLRHLMIFFDDGPCYEFICQSFRVEDAR
jgi:hypothetical protein